MAETEDVFKHDIFIGPEFLCCESGLHTDDSLLVGPGRSAPEDSGFTEETADSDPGRGTHSVEEETAAGWQRGSSGGGTGRSAVLVKPGQILFPQAFSFFLFFFCNSVIKEILEISSDPCIFLCYCVIVNLL